MNEHSNIILVEVKLGLNFIKCINVFGNKIKLLHVSANDGHHRKGTNTSKEMLHMYFITKTLLHLMELNLNLLISYRVQWPRTMSVIKIGIII
jgi:hypothetical protein